MLRAAWRCRMGILDVACAAAAILACGCVPCSSKTDTTTPEYPVYWSRTFDKGRGFYIQPSEPAVEDNILMERSDIMRLPLDLMLYNMTGAELFVADYGSRPGLGVSCVGTSVTAAGKPAGEFVAFHEQFQLGPAFPYWLLLSGEPGDVGSRQPRKYGGAIRVLQTELEWDGPDPAEYTNIELEIRIRYHAPGCTDGRTIRYKRHIRVRYK